MPRHSYESIQAEIARLQGLAKKLRKQHAATKQRARRKVVALMKKLGLTLGDLTATPLAGDASAKSAKTAAKSATTRKRQTKRVPIKYRGPHRGDTWTGRGRTPRWLAAYIAAGGKKEDYLIGK
ncbi:MAG: hypothetical protein C0496_15720 [Erythrobacter sp.]|nr:hypothetical protein [Erythrobacter sp.]